MKTRTAGLPFIMVTLFLDIVGIGLIIPIGPNLLRQLTGGSNADAAEYFGYIAASYAVVQFFFSPIMGSLSDRFGRRPVLILSTLGQGIDYVIIGLAPNVSWFFVGRIIAGLTGASIGTATAYIADVSPPEKRAQNFGFVGVAFGLGFIFGPLLGGVLGELGEKQFPSIGLRLPFFVAAGLTIANALYGVFYLPESLKPEHRRPFSLAKANPFGTLRALSKHSVVVSLLVTVFFVNLAHRSLESTWVLSATERFGWSSFTSAFSLVVVGVCSAFVQGWLVRRLIPKLGEKRMMLMGHISQMFTFIGYGAAQAGWVLFAFLPFGSLSQISQPATQGLLSRSVPPNEQGMLQGAVMSVVSLTQIIGPPVATQLFAFFISDRAPVKIPGIAFFLGVVYVMIGFAFALITFRRFPNVFAAPAPAGAVKTSAIPTT